jgi:hypothetical protein
MNDKKPPADPISTAPDESIAAQKARAALANPELQKALAELRSVTPEGEPLFGFQIKAKDARTEVPRAERVEIDEGAAIVAQKEAASAYVDTAAPAASPSPRMPSGRVRIIDDFAAGATRAETETRRQVTQPSIARGGVGPRPPALKGDALGDTTDKRTAHGDRTEPREQQEETAVGTVLDQPIPAARKKPVPPGRPEGGRRYGWGVILLGAFALGGIVAAVMLRQPTESGESGVSVATTSGTAAVAASPKGVPSVAATPTASVVESTSAVPSTPVVPATSGAPTTPTAAPKPSVAPATTAAPPSVTTPSSSTPTSAPAPSIMPSTAPTQAAPAPTATVKKPYFEMED